MKLKSSPDVPAVWPQLIERELDQAIMHVAENDQVTGDGAYDIGNALIQTITQAPTTAKRRIQQSLLLANRLQQKQKEAEGMLQEIHQLKQKLESSEAEVKLHKRLVERSNQPHNYILADIERRALELNANYKDWICDEAKMATTQKVTDYGALYMHCLPASIGEEVTTGIMEAARVDVAREAQKKVYAIMALLAIGKGPELAARLDALSAG